jgi:hypothetical protein
MERRISLYRRWAERIEADGIAIVDVISEDDIPQDVT